MANDFNNPAASQAYLALLQSIRDNMADVAKWLDGTTDSNLPTNAKRWNDTNKNWEKWSGTAWGALAATYGINVDQVDGYDVGNGVGKIPANNLVLNQNLIAHYLGASGQDAAFFRNASNMNAGTLPLARIPTTLTGKDADTLDGQHGSYYRNAGNMNAGNVPWAQRTLHKGCLIYMAGSTYSLADSTDYAIPFDNEDYDTDSLHDNSTNKTRITIPAGVSYARFTGKITFAANGTGNRFVKLEKNGSAAYEPGFPNHSLPGSSTSVGYVPFNSGWIAVTEDDYFEIVARQSSGGNLDLQYNAAGDSCWVCCEVK